jgi:AAA15 family ATPase/GTPase
MYLGIERRGQIERETPFRSSPFRPVRRRNIFAGSLAESLEEASELAAVRFRRIQESDDKLKDKLRNALLIRNFEFVDVIASGAQSQKLPDVHKVRADISRQRTNVKKALTSLGLSEQEIAPVDAFFGKMEEIVKALPSKSRLSNETPTEAAQVIWIFNEWQFNKVSKLVQLVDKFVADSRALYAPIDRFLATVNDFFQDSKKRIEINRFGMSVLIGDLPSRDLSSLSSGEQQLIVLLTHLAFNPSAAEANVLIIDEPELSLHIGWQEKFADALLKANPNIQFILATHSPAIVLDRDSKCKELPGT